LVFKSLLRLVLKSSKDPSRFSVAVIRDCRVVELVEKPVEFHICIA